MVRSWTDYTEPARLRAIAASVVGLVASLGLTLPFDLPAVVEVAIPVLSVVVPWVQGELTRRVVRPAAASVDAPGRHAAPE